MPIIIYRREKVKLLGAPAAVSAGAPRKTDIMLPSMIKIAGVLRQLAAGRPSITRNYHFPLSP